MTDLQASLIGIGVAIVVGVIAYNKWQEYRARKHVERAFSDPVDDVLMKTGTAESFPQRQEPVLDGFAAGEGPVREKPFYRRQKMLTLKKVFPAMPVFRKKTSCLSMN